MVKRPALLLVFAVLLAAGFAFQAAVQEPVVIDAGFYHLGNDPTPEWPEAAEQPDGERLDLAFEGRALEGEAVLMLTQRHVDDPWHVEINGVRIATLSRGAEPEDHHYVIPAGVLRDGENSFTLTGDVPADDITVGNIRYYEGSLREVFDLRVLTVRVSDESTGGPSPARVTFTDADGELLPLYYADRLHTAVRKGVAYTSDGEAKVEIPPGEVVVYAVRGTEWSLAQASVDVTAAEQEVGLALRRELDTTGFVACDTHIHTLTHSGHGDSSVEERMVTLAGEGVELAIATDHNHNTDYRPTQVEMGLQEYFTPVVGNEVSTPIGHLNAFPLDPGEAVPPYEVHDIAAAVQGCRDKGADVVILNHPRWPEHDTGPYGVIGLDHYTGEPTKERWTFPFDAMELINSQTEEKEPMLLFSDWFALLNRGEKVMAVGSSDSHTVGGVVGMGRTYVRSSTDDPAAIDVEECCRNIVAGRSSISMGIFVDLLSDGRSVMGEMLEVGRDLELRVAAPSWIQPEKVIVFVNGIERVQVSLQRVEGEPLDFRYPMPGAEYDDLPHDSWLACVVTGEGVGGPWWPQLNDYTLAATNPVFLDADGDGKWSNPRDIARALVDEKGTGPASVETILDGVDDAVAVQVLHLVREEYLREVNERMLELGRGGLSRQGEAMEASFLRGYLEELEGK